MNVYIWESVRHLTDAEHDAGGVVVSAQSLDQARDMLRSSTSWSNNLRRDAPIPRACEAFTDGPDMVYPVAGDALSAVFLFPDQGCC